MAKRKVAEVAGTNGGKNGSKRKTVAEDTVLGHVPGLGEDDDFMSVPEDDLFGANLGTGTPMRRPKPETKSGRKTGLHRTDAMKDGRDVDPSPDGGKPGPALELIDLELEPPRFMVVEVVGSYSLLENRPSPKTVAGIEGKQQGKGQSKKGPRNPTAEFLEAFHLIKGARRMDALATNVYGIPALAFKKAMLRAGYYQGEERNMASNMGSFFVHGAYGGLVRLNCDPPTMRTDVVTVKPAGTLTPCYRPEFWPWRATLLIKFWENLATAHDLLMWLQLAGQHGGVGSRRIARSGEPFGGFTVETVRELPLGYSPVYYRTEVEGEAPATPEGLIPVEEPDPFEDEPEAPAPKKRGRPRKVPVS